MATWYGFGSREIVVTGLAVFAIVAGISIESLYVIQGVEAFGVLVVIAATFFCQFGAFIYLQIIRQVIQTGRIDVSRGAVLIILGIMAIFGSVFIYNPVFGLITSVIAALIGFAIRPNLQGFIQSNIPDTPHKPMGPTIGRLNHPETFSSYATHPQGKQVQLELDWGDGTPPTLTVPVNSGRSMLAVHSWNHLGVFDVRVRALANGRYSNYSEPTQVTISP